jgi:hypothetical protein
MLPARAAILPCTTRLYRPPPLRTLHTFCAPPCASRTPVGCQSDPATTAHLPRLTSYPSPQRYLLSSRWTDVIRRQAAGRTTSLPARAPELTTSRQPRPARALVSSISIWRAHLSGYAMYLAYVLRPAAYVLHMLHMFCDPPRVSRTPVGRQSDPATAPRLTIRTYHMCCSHARRQQPANHHRYITTESMFACVA